jgi:transcriptional regulator with XRE-family HTH domain
MLWSRLVGQRLGEIRESKNFSQGEIERRTGFVPAFTSRIENGHNVPTVETLEKYAGALEVPLYEFFYEGEGPPPKSNLPATKTKP